MAEVESGIGSTFEKVREHWANSQRNKFWDAWGIVLRTETLYDLLAESPPVILTAEDRGVAHKLFGLTIIQANAWLDMMEQDCVIVDKPMGVLIIAWEAANKRRHLRRRGWRHDGAALSERAYQT